MTTNLSPEEQAELRLIIQRPTMVKAMDEALSKVFREKSGSGTLEQSAMSYQFTEGARDVLSKLQALANITDAVVTPSAKRFKPTKD